MADSPYFYTYLYTNVTLHPSQFDNDIYKHLKNNLIRKIQGKCYKQYGHVTKIYKIDELSGGNIIAEDTSASALYKVKFSCKICRPLKKSIIVCEVIAINKSLIYLRNGPINVFIFEGSGNVNLNNFIYDERRNVLLANIGGGKGIPVVAGTYIKIQVINSRIVNGSNKILVFGTLENIASKEEINDSIESKENNDVQFVEYDEFIKAEKEEEQEIVDEETETYDNESDDTDK
jgi:DNA-directed RNA polymerase subunit E'/Rpb7